MRWDPEHESPDVVDARRRSGMSGQSAYLLFRLASRFGWKGIVVAGLIMGGVLLFSSDPGPGDDQRFHFVSFVLDDVQDTWAQTLDGYERAGLVVFRGSTGTACGFGQSATGPFYCPLDRRVYLDLSFFDELSERLGAPGDFAQAYVVAHEVGHHVQDLLGTLHMERDSVRVELQADCYAGLWAASAEDRGLLEVGDIQESLQAAAAIGDDRLQRQSTGEVRPDSFTHGTSAQRVRWLRRGYEAGRIDACDTFEASQL